MKIKITTSDIKYGKTCSDRCPVALALKRETGKVAHVYSNRIELYSLHHHESFVLPKSAKAFIDKFDTHRKVKPFSFILKNSIYEKNT